ncbi:YjgF-like protein [Trametes versicolor FP-101664 SS1]|uniref:YjgF-like protein n=1 Tax=Trametes versicolor (strain FP-101664) TaxID=717944 RepID=UPI0004624048|nr:YjgF-like protein [Trametes versicolor FP-101664 SS1]EIW54791.1 YjgF-like protein [Trametes versicolor FP-101664 SS1]
MTALASPGSQRFQTANPYEKEFGYSRAVRRGPFIAVSGTTSIDPVSGQLRYPGSAYDQARAIFAEIVRAVEGLGGTANDIIRVRMFVMHGSDADSIGKALKEALGEVGPAATMIVGAQFVSSEMLVEIEADAVTMPSVNKHVCVRIYPVDDYGWTGVKSIIRD